MGWDILTTGEEVDSEVQNLRLAPSLRFQLRTPFRAKRKFENACQCKNRESSNKGVMQLKTTRIQCKPTTISVISTCTVLAITVRSKLLAQIVSYQDWQATLRGYLQFRTRYTINPPRRSTASSPYPDQDSPSQSIAPSETPRPHAY